MLQKMIGLISKDTKKEDESKNLVVVLRIILLLMLTYFLAIAGIASAYKLLFAATSSLVFFALFLCSFVLTYKLGMMAAYNCFSAVMMLWFFFSVIEIGWESGTQHLMLVLLVLRFFEAHTSLKAKLAFTLCLSVFTLSIYIFSLFITSNFYPDKFFILFNFLDIAVIFSSVTIVCWFFSSDTLRDETKLVLYNERLRRDALTDTLTGLANRRNMTQELEKSINRIKSQQDGIFSIAVGDIDFFKRINDTLGHDCGDVVLQELSKMFSQFIENKGKVARWGGEEFLFLFDGMNGDQALLELHKLIRDIRNSSIIYKKEALKVTMTFGLEEYDTNYDLTENIKNADKKLYLGKSSGRDRIIY